MKPIYKILANQKDITPLLQERLLSLTLHDEIGMHSDSVSFSLDNRHPKIPTPSCNATLDVYLGYEETGLVYKGQFNVDQIEISSPPDTMTIQASAADFKTSFKSPKSRSWENTTFERLLTTIAKENGYEPAIHPTLKDRLISHLLQTEESDLHLLRRLGYGFGATIKPVAGKLLVLPKGLSETATGQPLSPITLTEKHLRSYRLLINERGQYASVQARWYHVETGQEYTVIAGHGQPCYQLRRMFSDEMVAKSAAHSRLQQFLEGHQECSLELVGVPELFAEGSVFLQTITYPAINGSWMVKSIDHNVESSGYLSHIILTKNGEFRLNT